MSSVVMKSHAHLATPTPEFMCHELYTGKFMLVPVEIFVTLL